MKMYTLTAEQIIAIYDAGRNRGSEEESAFEWGSFPSGGKFDELENVLIWGDGIITGKEIDYDEKLEHWELFKKSAGVY